MSASHRKLDDQLRRLLCRPWTPESERALLALGQPALERLLDTADGALFATETQWRDFGEHRKYALAAFAKADLASVLAAMKARAWTDTDIALSGVGRVRDARLVPLLTAAYANRAPPIRRAAVELLGSQRDAQATATLLRALRDRSSDVRVAAIRALAAIGDSAAIDHLRQVADRHRSSPGVVREVAQALRQIRKVGRGA